MENYEVKQGDCLSSIAFEYGFFAETLWNHPKNAELKRQRRDMNVLMPGDTVFIPDKRLKDVERPTNELHKFRCKNAPEKLRIQLFRENEPRSDEKYELIIDDRLKFTGSTDGQGRLEQSIPPNAQRGELKLKGGEEVYALQLGHLNPNDQITGAQGRLRHLGFYFGSVNGQMSPELEHAIQEFQISRKLEPNGELDQNTLNALKEAYGS